MVVEELGRLLALLNRGLLDHVHMALLVADRNREHGPFRPCDAVRRLLGAIVDSYLVGTCLGHIEKDVFNRGCRIVLAPCVRVEFVDSAACCTVFGTMIELSAAGADHVEVEVVHIGPHQGHIKFPECALLC